MVRQRRDPSQVKNPEELWDLGRGGFLSSCEAAEERAGEAGEGSQGGGPGQEVLFQVRNGGFYNGG